MPPKAKFTKQDIINTTLKMVKEKGIESITARSLAEELHSSPRPIFTLYNSMDEVIQDTKAAIYQLYQEALEVGFHQAMPFKGVGLEYIKFAKNEPEYFKCLFMQNQKVKKDYTNALEDGEEFDAVISVIEKQYNLSKDKAARLYEHLSIYTHGIASFCATGACNFNDEEISELVSEAFNGIINKVKE